MFIILNAIVASLDGLIIGTILKFSKTKLTFKNYIIILLTNLFIYTSFIFLYYSFNFKFMTTTITTILYLFLAWNAYHENDNQKENYDQTLSIKKTIILASTHSLDGSIVSLNFVYDYNLLFITSLFSIASILLLILGYYFANILQISSKSNVVNALLFITLAIINLIL